MNSCTWTTNGCNRIACWALFEGFVQSFYVLVGVPVAALLEERSGSIAIAKHAGPSFGVSLLQRHPWPKLMAAKDRELLEWRDICDEAAGNS